MNINKKILFFAGSLIIVFLMAGFVSAKATDVNNDGEISFIEWLRGIFTGKIVEEGFIDYTTEDYDYLPKKSEIQQLEGTEVKLEEVDGFLEITGGTENSFVKIDGSEYDLSGEDNSLKIDPITGRPLPGSKFKTSQNVYPVSDNQKIRQFPHGTTVELLEDGGISITDPAGKTFKLENSEEFDILYSEGYNQIRSFSFKTGKNSKLSFNEGEFSFLEEGKTVSFTHHEKEPAILNIPGEYETKILKKPLDMFVNGKGIISEGIISGLNEDLSFKGHLGFNENGIAHTFRGEAGAGRIEGLELGNGITINTYATSSSSAYLFFEEPPAEFAEESHVIMGDELKFKNKEGDQNDVFILNKNKYIKDFDPERHFVALRSFGKEGEAHFLDGEPSIVETTGIPVYNGKEILKSVYSEELGRETFLFDTYSPKKDADLVSIGVIGKTSTGDTILLTFIDKKDTPKGEYNEIYLASSNPEKYLIPAAERERYGLSNYVIEGEQIPISQKLQEQIFSPGEKPDTRVAITEFKDGLENLPAFQETITSSTEALKEYKDMEIPRKELSNVDVFGDIIASKSRGRFTKEDAEKEVIKPLSATRTPEEFNNVYNQIITDNSYKYEYLPDYKISLDDVKGTSVEPFFKDMQDKSLKYELSLLDNRENKLITDQDYEKSTFYSKEELKELRDSANKVNMPVKEYLKKHPDELPGVGIRTLYNRGQREEILKKYTELPFVIQYIRK